MEGAVYLCDILSILGLSIEYSNTPLQYEAFGTIAIDPAPPLNPVSYISYFVASLNP